MASTHDLLASKLFSMKDHVCVITGGGSGIGLMAAQALSANGAKVYIASRRQEVLERAANTHDPGTGGSIIACAPCDVTKKEEIEILVQEISSKEERVDLLVTAAGKNGPKAYPDSKDANELKSKLWENETVRDGSRSSAKKHSSAGHMVSAINAPLLTMCRWKLGMRSTTSM